MINNTIRNPGMPLAKNLFRVYLRVLLKHTVNPRSHGKSTVYNTNRGFTVYTVDLPWIDGTNRGFTVD